MNFLKKEVPSQPIYGAAGQAGGGRFQKHPRRLTSPYSAPTCGCASCWALLKSSSASFSCRGRSQPPLSPEPGPALPGAPVPAAGTVPHLLLPVRRCRELLLESSRCQGWVAGCEGTGCETPCAVQGWGRLGGTRRLVERCSGLQAVCAPAFRGETRPNADIAACPKTAVCMRSVPQ